MRYNHRMVTQQQEGAPPGAAWCRSEAVGRGRAGDALWE